MTGAQARADDLRAGAIVRRIEHMDAPVVVEVGVAGGRLSRRLLARHPGAVLYMVDSYLPETKQPLRYRESGDVHATCTTEHQAMTRERAESSVQRFGARARMRVMDSSEAARQMEDRGCDMVFLDADHSYEAVTEDIRAWWPKVRPGGWLGGHDYGGWVVVDGERKYFGVERAVCEVADERGWTLELDDDWTWFVQRGDPT